MKDMLKAVRTATRAGILSLPRASSVDSSASDVEIPAAQLIGTVTSGPRDGQYTCSAISVPRSPTVHPTRQRAVLTVARRVVWRHAQNARVSGDVIVWRVDYTSIKVPERRGRGSVEAYPGAMQEEGVRVESREERKRGAQAQARELQ